MKDDHVTSPDSGCSPERIHSSIGRLPQRTNLARETAAILKEWIGTGVLCEELPGELQLKARLRVGRDTLRRALKLLTREGWVSPAVKGRQRRVRKSHRPPRNDTATDRLPVTILSPPSVAGSGTLLEIEDTRVQLAERGSGLRFISPDIFHLEHPERQLERLVREHPSAAWVLWMVNEPIQRWFYQQGIPAFLFGLPVPGVKLPFIARDWEAAAFHAGMRLVRRGHRVVGLLEDQVRFLGMPAEERGLRRALATVIPQGRLVVFKDDRSPASVVRCLESAFGFKYRPTALVLTRPAQLLTCLSWLGSQGLRTPADISLVSLAADGRFAEFHPSVCYYRSDSGFMARQIAQRVLELAMTGRIKRKSMHVPIEAVPGSTIGPAPRGPRELHRHVRKAVGGGLKSERPPAEQAGNEAGHVKLARAASTPAPPLAP